MLAYVSSRTTHADNELTHYAYCRNFKQVKRLEQNSSLQQNAI